MKLDKRMMVAVFAIAITAFAVTAASASATVWKDHSTGKEVKSFTLELTGGELFEAESGSYAMTCEIHATLVNETGTSGKITKFETKKCGEGAGELAKCELSIAEAKGLPWTVDLNATTLTITNMHTRRTFKTGCTIKELDKTLGSVTVTLLQPSEIAEMEWDAKITGYKIHDSFTVEGTNSGTYGIG